ncbi:MAG TPA: cyclase family protein [Syntrophorhabdales bacterium]|nr:cyclase family protein [Syntrophorhabdales bacterium]
MVINHDIIDLSRPIHTNMPVFPAITKTYLGIFTAHKDSVKPNGVSHQSNILVMGDHAGTHIDAPLHFNPAGTGIDQMPVDLLAGNAIMQDYSDRKPGESVTADDVKTRLERYRINPKDLTYILFRTDAAPHYGTEAYWSHYLEIRTDAVEWMLDEGILIFGVDASTVDHAGDRSTHMLMRKRPCYHIENLVNLDRLPQDRMFTFICAPLLMRDSSASPIRAFALVSRK